MRPLLLIAAVAAGLSTAEELRAQADWYADSRVDVGERVRLGVATVVTRRPVRLPSTHVVGRVRAIAPDTIYLDLAAPPPTIAVPRILIQTVELSLGPPSRLESAKETGAAGAVILGLLVPPFLPKRQGPLGSPTGMRIAGLAIGGTAGALVGVLRPYERWQTGWIPE